MQEWSSGQAVGLQVHVGIAIEALRHCGQSKGGHIRTLGFGGWEEEGGAGVED